MSLLPWATGIIPPDPATLVVRHALLASEGRPFSPAACGFVAALVRPGEGAVHVFSIARVWGTSLGFPNPGLLPSKQEWDAQRALVGEAVHDLQRRGIEATGHVVGTRRATRGILAEAARTGSEVIVMAADPPRHWFLQDMMWSQESYRVRRRAKLPVYLVPAPVATLPGGASP
jgi:hypothetical protein